MVDRDAQQLALAAERSTFSRLLPGEADAPGTARRLARAFMDHRVEGEARDELLLATSELVTNAVKYGGHQPIWLHLLLTPGELAVTVTNRPDGPWTEDLGGAAPAAAGDPTPDDRRRLHDEAKGEKRDALALGGRGLDIVREVCDEFAVFRGSVTIVRAARRR
jgi:anti-sigma regulatory factor (Ser/Thr protein kinase)